MCSCGGWCPGGHSIGTRAQPAQVEPAPSQHSQVPGRALQLHPSGVECDFPNSVPASVIWSHSRRWVIGS